MNNNIDTIKVFNLIKTRVFQSLNKLNHNPDDKVALAIYKSVAPVFREMGGEFPKWAKEIHEKIFGVALKRPMRVNFHSNPASISWSGD